MTEIGPGTEPAPSFLSFAELIEREGAAQGPLTAEVPPITQVPPTTQAARTAPAAASSAAVSQAASPQAGYTPRGFPRQVIWPVVGVLGAVGLTFLVGAGRRQCRRFKA